MTSRYDFVTIGRMGNFNGNSTFNWNGNSFSDCSLMHADAPVRPVAPWKLGIHQAAMIRGEGAV